MKSCLKVIVIISFSIVILIIDNSCKKNPLPPSVSTSNVTLITQTSASSGGNVTNDGGAEVTSRGICWGTGHNPDVSSAKTTDGSGTGSFTSQITNLTANTEYYVRAYAINSAGIAYGTEASFTTSPVVLATVTTTAVSSVTSSSGDSGGNITSDGGSEITDRGICWSTSQNPTISDNKLSEGSGIGSFICSITGLNSSTTYYVRAYALNSAGTAYGITISFTTEQSKTLTDADGNVYNLISIGSQIWMAENLKTGTLNDGTPITFVTDGSAWNSYSIPAYCFYDNDVSKKTPYGALYNWYAVNSGKLCPAGWHVPSKEEFETLLDTLGGGGVAEYSLKEVGTTHWNAPNDGATNESGFTALPGGWCNSYVSPWEFRNMGTWAYWWTSTEVSGWYSVYDLILGPSYTYASISNNIKNDGLSVRCLKN